MGNKARKTSQKISNTEEQVPHSSVDVNKLVVDSIKGYLSLVDPLQHEFCIYRIPQRLRRTKENAYTPQVVSIGPLHHKDKNLLRLQNLKLSFLRNFLDKFNMDLNKCVKEITTWDARVRGCYAEKIEVSIKELAEIVLVDGVFIIEVLLRFGADDADRNNCTMSDNNNSDPRHFKAWALSSLRPDMVLLENQLPFFVLEGLFNMAFPANERILMTSLLDLSLKYFHDLMLTTPPASKKDLSQSEIQHFVDLLRICHLPSSLRRPRATSPTAQRVSIRNATQLQDAGMKVIKKSEKIRLLDIDYEAGKLQIPHMKIRDETEIVLRNLIALEIFRYRHDSYIIDYVYFMDDFIDNTKDVDLLIQNGIIENWLGDNYSVALMFNTLTKETSLSGSNFYYHGTCKRMNKFCKVARHRWEATLKSEYCSTPWRIASTSAAIILLLLTFSQTIFSAISL
ncbi:UPF0481 protein At3g47200-like [Malania oleifera]|uniref:UPF0481 protein At3g47200-like n=1 Tax=Malania oleifera TaxID=397392 RepID=UPI0025AE2981|nr:UPF0481 protein At3g47200-like [Malania oleifera]